MTSREFGAYIKELRVNKGLSLREAAKRIDINHMRLSEIESGKSRGTGRDTRPRREVVIRMAEVYEVPVNTLLEKAGFAAFRSEADARENLLIDLFRELSEDQQEMVIRLLRAARG